MSEIVDGGCRHGPGEGEITHFLLVGDFLFLTLFLQKNGSGSLLVAALEFDGWMHRQTVKWKVGFPTAVGLWLG